MFKNSLWKSAIVAALAIVALAVAKKISDTRVTIGSPVTPFTQNKQNEPWVAIDPSNPLVLAAGANDEIDLESCAAGDPTTCPFTAGVGLSGISFSFDGGLSWTQPVYSGFSARNCLGPEPCVPEEDGPIGTLPFFDEQGIVSDGDPSLVFGPRPAADGSFSWANGSRLYYSSLTSNFSFILDEQTFLGFEAIAVSRVDDVAAAGAGDENAWLPPVIISRQNEALFSDKEAIWADNAETSPHFGNVYICNVAFRGAGVGFPEPVMVARSLDGGDTWNQRQISEASNSGVPQGRAGGRQGCVVRSDSQGTVYVFWEGSFQGQGVVWLSRSFDGGDNFDMPRPVANVDAVGEIDPVQGVFTFDGIAGARTSVGPTADIANGAPTGENAPDIILLGYADGSLGLNNERARVQFSTDGGETFSAPVDLTEPGDRPDFPWVAISPDGEDVYITYMGFLDPWRVDLSSPRRMQGVVRHADFADLANPVTLHRGEIGDARGSSANSMAAEFLGDYDYIAATNEFAVAVWNDVRNAGVCEAVNAFRAGLANVGPSAPTPAPAADCPPNFGNSDIFGIRIEDPTP